MVRRLPAANRLDLGTELPHEQELNQWVNAGHEFPLFLVRKTMFIGIYRPA